MFDRKNTNSMCAREYVNNQIILTFWVNYSFKEKWKKLDFKRKRNQTNAMPGVPNSVLPASLLQTPQQIRHLIDAQTCL